jgi:hypothetical protein
MLLCYDRSDKQGRHMKRADPRSEPAPFSCTPDIPTSRAANLARATRLSTFLCLHPRGVRGSEPPAYLRNDLRAFARSVDGLDSRSTTPPSHPSVRTRPRSPESAAVRPASRSGGAGVGASCRHPLAFLRPCNQRLRTWGVMPARASLSKPARFRTPKTGFVQPRAAKAVQAAFDAPL